MHGLVRCKHERRCSRAGGGGRVIQRCHYKNHRYKMWSGGCEWRHASQSCPEDLGGGGFEKSQLVEFLLRTVELSSNVRRRRLTFGARGGLTAGVAHRGGRWKSRHRKIVPLSFFCRKSSNSKVIKSFVPELRSRQVLFVFRDSYVIYIWVMNILCKFHIFMYGYVTPRIFQMNQI